MFYYIASLLYFVMFFYLVLIIYINGFITFSEFLDFYFEMNIH